MSSPISWARVVATTIQNYFPEVEVEVLRSRRLGAMLENRGRIKMNVSGDGWEWRIQYRLPEVSTNDGTTVRTFAPQNLWKVATLAHRGYQATDAITKGEALLNTGREAIVKVTNQIIKNLRQTIDDAMSEDYYLDGNATGNTERFQGIETFLGINGTVDSSQTGGTTAQRAANAADPFGYPSDSYAGLSTQLGTYGGANRATASTGPDYHWPNGTADAEFDFFTPIIINYTSTYFNGATPTWAEQCLEAMRLGIVHANRNASKTGQLDFYLLDRTLYVAALNKLDAKERVMVTNTTGLRSFGFKNVFELDGVEVSYEYGVPSAVGYGFNINQMELLSLQSKLMVPEGPTWHQETQTWRSVVDVLANLRFRSVRNFVKLAAIA